MGAKKSGKRSLTDPTKLKPIDKKEGLLQVIIETPKGSRNKYSFDVEQKIFSLKKVLPSGMAFPYDFGFLPRTLADDGDPIDVLVLMDEPAFPGCALKAKLIGVMEGEQVDGDERVRNDRLIAVAEATHTWRRIRKMSDLSKHFTKELEDFFINYHQLEGKKYKVLGCKGKDAAIGLIKKSEKAA